MKKELFALKGMICYSKNQREMVFMEDSYVVCENGICAGVFSQLPEEYKDVPVEDLGNRLIIPGFTDLHLHAPQYAYRGTGMDLELLDWLNTITFPQEARYADLSYAKKAYSIFVDDLKHSFTTRACIFATLHRPYITQFRHNLQRIQKNTGLWPATAHQSFRKKAHRHLRRIPASGWKILKGATIILIRFLPRVLPHPVRMN